MTFLSTAPSHQVDDDTCVRHETRHKHSSRNHLPIHFIPHRVEAVWNVPLFVVSDDREEANDDVREDENGKHGGMGLNVVGVETNLGNYLYYQHSTNVCKNAVDYS